VRKRWLSLYLCARWLIGYNAAIVNPRKFGNLVVHPGEKEMTRKLLLMRHAKSDWKDVNLRDKERPLNARGRGTAPIMASWLVEHQHLPNLVLCSSAIRTQQTLDLMIHQWTAIQMLTPSVVLPEIYIDDLLYLASDSAILSFARAATTNGEARQCVRVLGHNPGMEKLASKLSGDDITMPTGAIAILASDSVDEDWPKDWSDANMWKWRGLVKPRELGTETV